MKGWILFSGEPVPELTKMQEAAKSAGIDMRIIDPATIQFVVGDKETTYYAGDEQLDIPNFAIAAFIGSANYHNISVLNSLEGSGVLCINKASTLLKTKDKLLTLQLLAAEGIPVPKTLLLSFPAPLELIEKEFSYPLVLKVIGGSKGDGVVLIDSRKQLKNMVQMFEAGGITEDVLVQEFIESSKGRDLRILLAGHEPITAMVRKNMKADGFKSNYSTGGTVESFELTEQAIELAKKVSKIIDLNIGGIDLLFTEDGFKVCEANSMPGFQGMEKASGANVAAMLLKTVLQQAQEFSAK